jgi:hypothetical protein
VTIAEVEEIVEIGEIPPDHVHVPSIYVQKVIKGKLIIYKVCCHICCGSVINWPLGSGSGSLLGT